MKFIKFAMLLLTLTCCKVEKRIIISIPNNYEGNIVIEEDAEYVSYSEKTFENFNVYEYKTNKFGTLKVKNISIFKDWNKVSFGFINVTPVYKVNEKTKIGDFIISEPIYFDNRIEAIVIKKNN
ncbi:hypothetical protein ACFFVB_16215 [Formosa undariae]|jgi:uncharacterized membrane protein|uniref:Lipoprotein n=1 Tax=Formosa undariae TaxID=1325436 RepID=A0ABV5F5I5_9FLAO